MTMTREQQEQRLAEKLNASRIEHRKGSNGKTFSYLEAWELIETANAIFGFFGWSRETIAIEPLHDPALITDADNPERGKVVAAYYAKVRISVYVDGRTIVREGCGAARGFAKTAGEAMENAAKASESDAMKRALVTFGSQFGLALYDREQRNVARPDARQQIASQHEPPLDTGFDQPSPTRPSISQRALGVSRNGKMTANVRDLPV
jgi:DNA repair and recombination protein RAD52